MADPTSIQLMVFDVDGVLTDGAITYSEDAALGGVESESKNFHTKDGLGLIAAMESGVQVAIITARKSRIVTRRMKEIGIQNVTQGCKNKAKEVARIAEALDVPLEHTAYLGDDLVDLPAMLRVGYPMAVADAAVELHEISAFVTKLPGGRGAAREAVEHVLKAQGKWQAFVERYLYLG